MPQWITTKAAAELSGYNQAHLRRLIRAGTIKARHFGLVWQVDTASLQAHMKKVGKSQDRRQGPKKGKT